MMSHTTKPNSSQRTAEMAVDLFDNWFDPIETAVRARARDLKNNKDDIPDKLNDHTADCIRYRLRHNTPTVSFRRRWIA